MFNRIKSIFSSKLKVAIFAVASIGIIIACSFFWSSMGCQADSVGSEADATMEDTTVAEDMAAADSAETTITDSKGNLGDSEEAGVFPDMVSDDATQDIEVKTPEN